jgi:hypothetical protein
VTDANALTPAAEMIAAVVEDATIADLLVLAVIAVVAVVTVAENVSTRAIEIDLLRVDAEIRNDNETLLENC